ncbi:MAG: TolC family protein [Bacteroidetes bacterium]|nr:TolC family protein [Bacteroidota bacterium]
MTTRSHFSFIFKASACYALLFTFSIAAMAQEKKEVMKLDLAQAVELGLKNRMEVKNQMLSVQLAENEVNKIKSKNLPQINATYDNRINTQLQKNIITSNSFPGGSGTLTLGTYSFNVLSLSATQNIYNPANHEDKKITAAKTEVEQHNLQKTKIDLNLAISQAYYDALLKIEKVKTSQYNFDQANAYYVRGQEQLKNGGILPSDLTKYELDKLNALNALENDKQAQQLSLINLVNQLGLPLATELELTEPLAASDVEKINGDLPDVNNRIELQVERAQLRINEMNLKKQKASYIPTISLYGNYTTQQLNNSNYDPTRFSLWNQYNYFGFKVELPVFDGFAKERNKQEYALRAEQNRNNLIKLQSDLAYELQSAVMELNTSINNFNYARQNYELAKRVLEVDQARLREGAITPADLKNTEYSVRNSQTNYLNSIFNYFIAKLKWQKAKGEL